MENETIESFGSAFASDFVKLHERVFEAEYGAGILEKVREQEKSAHASSGVFYFMKEEVDYWHYDLLARYAEAASLRSGEKPKALFVLDGNVLNAFGSEELMDSVAGLIRREYSGETPENPFKVQNTWQLSAVAPFEYHLKWELKDNYLASGIFKYVVKPTVNL